MRRLPVLLALAALVVAALPPAPAGAVVGGREADPGEWPWQVALLVAGGPWCGGSLISPEVVLTAAHCTDDLDPGDIEVLAGTVDLRAGGERRGVASIDQHEAYDRVELQNDISLLFLEEPFALSDTLDVVRLATVEESIAYGEGGDPVVVTGFGATDEIGGSTSVLLEADLEAFDDARCTSLYAEDGDEIFGDTQVCAGLERGHVDACYGDSGGPLVAPVDEEGAEWRQIGLVSWGAGCAAPRRPTIYTEVASFIDWLDERGVGPGAGVRVEGEGTRIPARGTVGKAADYPLRLDVDGFEGQLESVSVRLEGLRHERPSDLGVWLVAPDGTVVTLLSEAGGDDELDETTVLVVDGAGAADREALRSQVGPTDLETDPRHKGPDGAANLDVLSGIDANGEWRLLIADDQRGAAGHLESWSLQLR